MGKLHKAARQAIDALQEARDHIYLSSENEQSLTDEEIFEKLKAAITDLHKALYVKQNGWVGLTDEEIGEAVTDNFDRRYSLVLAIEAKLKEKNG